MPSITLDAAFDCSLLPAEGGGRFLRLRLRAPEVPREAGAARKPLNLAFVLDRSGSMAGEKLDLVKRAVAFGIGQLAPDDRAAVVVYDDRIETIAPSTRMDAAAKSAIALRLGAVRDGGSTALGEGWLTGCRLVATVQSELGDRWLTRALLLTDGLANVGLTDPHELIGHAVELRRRGVTTTTFGVGADFDEQLLRGLSEGGGGNFYFIERAAQIPDFFAGELGELLTVYAEGATVTLTLPNGLSAQLLNDYPVTRASGEWPAPFDSDAGALGMEIGNLSAGEEKVLLFALTGAPAMPGTALPIAASLDYRLSANGQVVKADDARLALRYASPAEVAVAPVAADVIELAGRLQAARAKQEAWEHNRAGRYAAAQATLRTTSASFAAPAMAAAAPALAEQAAELDRLAEQAAHGWDSQTSKQTLYSSDLVRRSRRDYGRKS